MKHVVIMGGGLAGLAAALRLSEHPILITLLESSPKLGGRAYSFAHAGSNDQMDNGQHVLMGCYRDTLRYMKDIGTTHLVQRNRGLALPFFRADGKYAVLQAGGLPHPLGLLKAFLRYDMLPFTARMRIALVALRLRALSRDQLEALDALTASTWLKHLRQGDEAIEAFWRPVILATMNTEPTQASAKLLAVVLREIFLSNAEAADMLVPKTALGALFIDGAARLLSERGVCVRMHAGVERIGINAGAIEGVVLRDGEAIEADAVISALPSWSLRRVLESSEALPVVPVDFDAFQPSEILSVHVWMKRDLGLGAMTGLLGTKLQWVFFKGKESDGRYRYSCTISAAGDDVPRDATALRPLLLRELQIACADLQDADILQLLPIREKRATFIPAPGLENVRPAAATSIHGFVLAGDWTATGLPATIEGAIRSGFVAAEQLLASMQR